MVHDPEDGQVSCSCDITNVLVQFEHKTAISDDLPSLLEGFIKIGLLFKFYSSVIECVGVECGEPVLAAVFALVMHHVIVVADRMDVDKGALADAAHPCAVLQAHGMRFTPWALHQLLSNYYKRYALLEI